MSTLTLNGWMERDGNRLSIPEIERLVKDHPEELSQCGGEFFLSWDSCSARDQYGIMEGPGPKGMILCNGEATGTIAPTAPEMSLEEAIAAAVRLRSNEGVVALSGGVDSALVAALAKRECVAVGLEGSHDLKRARAAADSLGLACTFVTIREQEIASALPIVVRTIPEKNPVNTGIALTLYFVARWAGENGYRRIITGQGADELFGGYSRYLTTETLEEDLARDFAGLEAQVRRDQSVAALHGAYFSLPYMDFRVVRAAQAVPAAEKVQGGRRKIPLRTVAGRYISQDLAGYEKKAMQYGSGVWDTLRKLARKNGYKTSMQDYIDHISRVEHGH
ncbi:MAG TPA: asparagine synthase C-terminal domain-containing protein [Methanoregula sp.]|nr:asparagine synthase C-terminal domain-containing protein [Methanoregula sp.]